MKLWSILGALYLAVTMAAAAQTARQAAEDGVASWNSRNAAAILRTAHPELLVHLHRARASQNYVAAKKLELDLDSASDTVAVDVLCRALVEAIPPQDPKLEYFDTYLSERMVNDKAIVEFDSGWRERAHPEHSTHTTTRVLVKKFHDRWLFLWSPTVALHVDLSWDPLHEEPVH